MPVRARRTVRRLSLSIGWRVALSLGVMSLGCGDRGQQLPAAAPVKVKVAVLREELVAVSADLLGSLNSRQSVQLTPQVSGHISAILVKAGDRVTQGQVLLQIDPERERATLASLEAARAARQSSVQLAEQNEERAAKLAPAGVISAQELQQAASALASAKAELLAADSQIRAQQEQIKYYRITAPNDGTVGDIPVKVGDLVGPTTRLLLLDQNAQLEAYVSVPLSRAPQLSSHTRLSLLGSDDKPVVEAAVSFISPSVDPETQSVLVKAVFPNTEKLLFAQFIRVRVTFDEKPGLKIPTTAVSRISGQYFVFVVQVSPQGQKTVQQRNVRLGEIIGNGYVVLDGLKAGDQVVIQGSQKVQDGAHVEPEAG